MSKGLLRGLAWAVMVLMAPIISSPFFFILPVEGLTLGFVVGAGLAFTILGFGFWLTLRVPDNLVTWCLYLGVASALTSQAASDYVNAAGELSLPAARVVFAAQLGVFWAGMVLIIVMFPLLFPTGQPPTRRWWWVAALGALGVLPSIVEASYLAATLPLDQLEDGVTGISVLDAVVSVGQGMVLVAGLIALSSLIVRYRRSVGAERQQIKWLLLPVSFLVLFWLIENLDQESPIAVAFLVLGAVTLPVAISMAVLKYRLYDIDRIISRTASYAVVVGVLGVVFFGVVTVVSSVLPGESPLAVATSTLAVAALFNPVRGRVQGWVDRRFNRSRYDAERVITAFVGTLRDRVDPDGVVDGWVGVVSETMQPSSVSVWVRE